MAAHPTAAISFCAGIGGLDLGIAAVCATFRTVCFVEGEAYAASVLVARQKEGQLHPAPVWSDVRTFDARPWRGKVDCIIAGYPCQPFSEAGKRRGQDDPRHLWPDIAKHIGVIRPQWVFLENVPGHLSLGFDQVACHLQNMGYTIEAGIFSAAEVGAPHLRKRLFCLAYLANSGSTRCACRQSASSNAGQLPRRLSQFDGPSAALAHANRQRELQQKFLAQRDVACVGRTGYRSQATRIGPIKPRMGRGVNGPAVRLDGNWAAGWENGLPRVKNDVPFRQDRLRALGNAVVPQTAAAAYRALRAQLMSRGI